MNRTIVTALLALAVLAPAALATGCGVKAAANEHRIQVTDKGFEPQVTEVKKGETATLLVTRRSDHTCATEMVLAGGQPVDLPLNRTVRVTVTPAMGDTVRYACGMGMYTGMVVAR